MVYNWKESFTTEWRLKYPSEVEDGSKLHVWLMKIWDITWYKAKTWRLNHIHSYQELQPSPILPPTGPKWPLNGPAFLVWVVAPQFSQAPLMNLVFTSPLVPRMYQSLVPIDLAFQAWWCFKDGLSWFKYQGACHNGAAQSQVKWKWKWQLISNINSSGAGADLDLFGDAPDRGFQRKRQGSLSHLQSFT